MPFLRMSASKSTDNRNFRLFVRWAQDHRLPDIWKESSLDRLLGGYVCTNETAWSVSSAAINRSCKVRHDENAAEYLRYSGSWTGGPAQRLNAAQVEEVPLRGDLII